MHPVQRTFQGEMRLEYVYKSLVSEAVHPDMVKNMGHRLREFLLKTPVERVNKTLPTLFYHLCVPCLNIKNETMEFVIKLNFRVKFHWVNW